MIYEDTLLAVSEWYATDELADSLEFADSLTANYSRYYLNDSIWQMIYEDTLLAVSEWYAADELADSLELADSRDSIHLLLKEIDNYAYHIDSLYGCIDESACNYDEFAIINNYQCDFPLLGYTCKGEVDLSLSANELHTIGFDVKEIIDLGYLPKSMDIHNVTINGCSFNSGWDLIDYGGGHPDVNLEFNFSDYIYENNSCYIMDYVTEGYLDCPDWPLNVTDIFNTIYIDVEDEDSVSNDDIIERIYINFWNEILTSQDLEFNTISSLTHSDNGIFEFGYECNNPIVLTFTYSLNW